MRLGLGLGVLDAQVKGSVRVRARVTSATPRKVRPWLGVLLCCDAP